MKYLLTIFILIGCNTTKTLPPIPPIKPPLDDTSNVLDRTLTPSIIILDGTRSKIVNGDGTGYFKSIKWVQILGKRFPIDNKNSIKTTTTVKSSGKLAWKLTIIDNLGNSASDTFTLIKN